MSAYESKDNPLSVGVEGDQLVIRIGVSTLAHSAKHSEAFVPYDDECLDYMVKFAVSDEHEFAKGVGLAINEEHPDDGSTPLTRIIDAAFLSAIENDYGIKEVKEPKPYDHRD